MRCDILLALNIRPKVVLPCLALSCHVVPCLVVSCVVVCCSMLLGLILSCLILSCRSCLLVWSLPLDKMGETFNSLTCSANLWVVNIKTVVNLGIANQASAASTYGLVKMWDVSSFRCSWSQSCPLFQTQVCSVKTTQVQHTARSTQSRH